MGSTRGRKRVPSEPAFDEANDFTRSHVDRAAGDPPPQPTFSAAEIDRQLKMMGEMDGALAAMVRGALDEGLPKRAV